jgi:type I restriction enzyme S subunit
MSQTLPQGWELAKLSDLGIWSSGGTPSRKIFEYFQHGVIPWVKTGDLNDGIIDFVEEKITLEALKNSSAKLFPKGTLLVAMYGATIGKTGLLPYEAATNQACAALLPNSSNSESLPYVWKYLLSKQEELKAVGQGGAQPNISQTILKEFPIPLPPLAEQKRMVAKLEALLTHNTNARNELAAIPKLIERYKQAVLAAAFNNLPRKALRLVAQKIQYGYTSKSSNNYAGAKYLRITDIQDNAVDWATVPHIENPVSALSDYRLNYGDIVFARSGATVGKSYLIDRDVPESVFASYLIRVVCKESLLIPEFAYLFFQSSDYWDQIKEGATGTGQPNFNGTKLGNLLIPYCDVSTQLEFVRDLKCKLERINILEAELTKAEALRTRLEQATLAKAFRGELVPQNPSDEPASVLLERVRAEREAQPKTTKKRGGNE